MDEMRENLISRLNGARKVNLPFFPLPFLAAIWHKKNHEILENNFMALKLRNSREDRDNKSSLSIDLCSNVTKKGI